EDGVHMSYLIARRGRLIPGGTSYNAGRVGLRYQAGNLQDRTTGGAATLRGTPMPRNSSQRSSFAAAMSFQPRSGPLGVVPAPPEDLDATLPIGQGGNP